MALVAWGQLPWARRVGPEGSAECTAMPKRQRSVGAVLPPGAAEGGVAVVCARGKGSVQAVGKMATLAAGVRARLLSIEDAALLVGRGQLDVYACEDVHQAVREGSLPEGARRLELRELYALLPEPDRLRARHEAMDAGSREEAGVVVVDAMSLLEELFCKVQGLKGSVKVCGTPGVCVWRELP